MVILDSKEEWILQEKNLDLLFSCKCVCSSCKGKPPDASRIWLETLDAVQGHYKNIVDQNRIAPNYMELAMRLARDLIVDPVVQHHLASRGVTEPELEECALLLAKYTVYRAIIDGYPNLEWIIGLARKKEQYLH